LKINDFFLKLFKYWGYSFTHLASLGNSSIKKPSEKTAVHSTKRKRRNLGKKPIIGLIFALPEGYKLL